MKKKIIVSLIILLILFSLIFTVFISYSLAANEATKLVDSASRISSTGVTYEKVSSSSTASSTYSFSLQANSNTTIEWWGSVGTVRSDPNDSNSSIKGYYIIPSSDSLSGSIGCYIYNVGNYNGTNVNLKCTFDWESITLNSGSKIYPVIGVKANPSTGIIYFMYYTTAYGVKYELIDDNGNAITANLSLTLEDIDSNEYYGFKTLTGTLKTIQSLSTNVNYYNYYNSMHWFMANGTIYTDDDNAKVRLEIANTSSFYVWVGSNNDNYSKSGLVRYSYATSSASDSNLTTKYNALKSGGDATRGWFYTTGTTFGVYEVPTPTKTVSDSNESLVTSSTATSLGETITYTINQFVPLESSGNYYSSFKITDTLPSCLTYVSSSIYDSSGSSISSNFTVSQSSNTLTLTAKSTSSSSFYGTTIKWVITTKLNSTISSTYYNSSTGYYNFTNSATVTVVRNSTTTTKTSNTVTSAYKRDATVTVKYVDKNTSETLATATTISGKVLDSYSTSSKSISGYTLVGNSGNTSGTMTASGITVTYYYAKNTSVILNYIDKPNNTTLETSTISGYVGKSYSTSSKSFTGYTLIESASNASGTMTESTITVNYYYAKNTEVIVNYIDKPSNTTLETSTISGYVGKSYSTSSKDFTGYTLIETASNPSGSMTESTITVNYYYAKNTKVVVNYIDRPSNNSILETYTIDGYVSKDYTTSSKDFTGYTLIETASNPSGEMTEATIEVNYYYAKNTDVVVNYIDKTRDEILETYTIEGYVTKDYTTSAKDITGYTLVETPSNKDGSMTEETITVNYYYLYNCKITVLHVDRVTSEVLGTDIYTGLEGESVTTSSKTFTGYSLAVLPYTETYTYTKAMSDAGYTVRYYYGYDCELQVNHVDIVTNEILDSDEYYGIEADKVNTTSKDISGYILLVTPYTETYTLTRQKITTNYYYGQVTDVVVNYIDKATGDMLDTYTIDGYVSKEYTTSAKDFTGYTLIETASNAAGKMTESTIEVNYYYGKNSNVIVNYLEEGTTEVLDTYTIEGYYSKEYSTESKNFTGYTYVSSTDNTKGTFGTADITVNYYYLQNTSLVVKYVDYNTADEIIASKTIYGLVGDIVTTEEENINGYTLIKKPDTEEYTLSKEVQTVTYYYAKNTNVIVNYIDKASGDILSSYTIDGYVGEDYSTSSKVFTGYTCVSIPSNQNGVITENTPNVNYYYLYNCSLTVYHIDKNSSDVLETKEYTSLEGESITTSSIDKSGYILVEAPSTEDYTLAKTNEAVYYYYVHVSEGVIEKHIDMVTGEILYQESYEGNEGDSYSTAVKDFTRYDFIKVEITPAECKTEGTMTQDLIEIKYYYKYVSIVNVEYIDKYSGEEVLTDTITDYDGESYSYEPKKIEGYKIDDTCLPENSSGTYSKKDELITYYVIKKSEGVTAYYLDKQTGESVADSESLEGYEGDKYSTTIKDIEGYTLVQTSENTVGVMQEEEIKVYYYYLKNCEVIANYIDKISSDVLKSTTLDGLETYDYETEQKDFEGYTYISSSNNTKGTFTREPIEVNYYYSKNTDVVVNYIDKTTGKVLDTYTIDGYIGKKYETSSKDIQGYTLIETASNAIGDMTEETITVNYYYVKNTKVIVNHIDKITDEILETLEIDGYLGKDYSTSSKEIEGYTLVETPSNEEGSMEEENIVNYYYIYNSKVTVNYVDLIDNTLLGTTSLEGLEQETYETEQKDFEGYTYMISSDNTKGTFTKDEIEVNYYYLYNSKVTVYFVDNDTNEVLETKEYTSLEGETVSISSIDIEGYNLVELPEDETYVLSKDNQDVYYYYSKVKTLPRTGNIDITYDYVIFIIIVDALISAISLIILLYILFKKH